MNTAVSRAAAVLDQTVPGWADHANPDTIDLMSSYSCILGQVGRRSPEARRLIDQRVLSSDYLRILLEQTSYGFKTLYACLAGEIIRARASTAFFPGSVMGIPHADLWRQEIQNRVTTPERTLSKLLGQAKTEPVISDEEIESITEQWSTTAFIRELANVA